MTAAEGVTFAVPLYNKAPYVRATLESIAAQEGDFAREIVDDDDGSTDGGVKVVDQWKHGCCDVRLIRQANQGLTRTTNRLIAMARYRFIKLVDADDILHPAATSMFLDAFRMFPDTSLIFCNRVDFAHHISFHIPLPTSQKMEYDLICNPMSGLIIRNDFGFCTIQMMFPTSLAHRVGGCDERMPEMQDYSLALRLATLGPFVRIKANLAGRRVGVQGALTSRLREREFLSMPVRLFGYFLQDFPDVPVAVRRRAARRAAGRAWRWCHRHGGAGLLSWWSVRRLWSFLPPRDTGAFLLRSAEAIEAVGAADEST
jgi:hypothetical protein